jgi:hypothetical protein
MEISEKYFKELLLETPALEAVATLDQFWCTHFDSSDRVWLGLSEPEHHVHVCLLYTGEVGNGGHVQFFWNHGREMAERTLRALGALNFGDLYACLSDACRVFRDGLVPKDRAGVKEAVDGFTPEHFSRLDGLDSKVWSIRNLDDSMLRYLRLHEGDILRRERGLTGR